MKTLIRSLVCAFATLCAFQLSAASIGTAAEFVAAMNNDPAGSYTLTADIDLADSGYATIATFSGTLDGAGHKLSGIGAQPLFTSCSGTLKNLKVDGSGATIWGTQTALVCTESRGATFQDVSVGNATIKVNDANKGTGIGLFVGMAYDGTSFVRCETLATAKVDGNGKANDNLGGFVGKVLNSTVLTGDVASFTDCTNNAAVVATSGDNNASQGTGGFVGKIELTATAAADVPVVQFLRCQNHGDISVAYKSAVGGFVGRELRASGSGIPKMTFAECLNDGDVTCSGTIKDSGNFGFGGFIGMLGSGNRPETEVTFSKCVNRGEINSGDAIDAGGFIGMSQAMLTSKPAFVATDSANYGAIYGRKAGGVIGSYNGNQYNVNGLTIKNSANYGSVSAPDGGMSGEFFGSAQNVFTYDLLDNVFARTSQWGTYTVPSGKTAPAVKNTIAATDGGYTATTACASLSARAKELALDEWWKVGKVSGMPELLIWSGDVWKIWTIRYLDDDGETVLNEQQVEDGMAAPAVSEPSRPGYVFDGWKPAVPAVITADFETQATYRQAGTGEIGSAADFVRELTANPAGTFTIKNDIDLTGAGYATIAEFSGTLDGGGKTITGLGSTMLFTTLSGTVRNLTIDGRVAAVPTTVSVAKDTSWAVLSATAVAATVEDVTIKGYDVTYAGVRPTGMGLFFAVATTTAGKGCCFTRCRADASCSIRACSNMNIGGIVGRVNRDSAFYGDCAVFTACTNAATISTAGSGNAAQGTGGICGLIDANADEQDGVIPSVCFINCVNVGALSLTGLYDSFGGIVGQVKGGKGSNKKHPYTGASIVSLVGCENHGSIVCNAQSSSKPWVESFYAGGLVGSILEKGSAVLSNCVNRADVLLANDFLVTNIVCGGIVGMMDVGGLPVEIVNSANYGAVKAHYCGGLTGKVSGNPGWDVGNVFWYNSANYGSLLKINETSDFDCFGQVVGLVSSGTGPANHFVANNCFGQDAVACAAYSVFGLQNYRSTKEAGYDPYRVTKALNTVALANGWTEWKTGKWDDGTCTPELLPFCTRISTRGLVITICGAPSASPTPPLETPDEPDDPVPADPPVVANQLLNLAPAPSGGRFATPTDRVWPATVGAADICLWHDDRFAACAITIDDNCRPDHDWWQALSDELGIHFTWFVITDQVDAQGTREGTFQGNWAEWQLMADRGHSIQSHTTNHKSDSDTVTLTEGELRAMYKNSLDDINAHITNNVACCIAYPSGDAHEDIAKDYVIAARGVYGVPSTANAINYICTNKGGSNKGTVEMVAFGATTEDPKWIQGKKELARGLNIVLYHYVHAGSTDEQREQNAATAEAEVRYIASLKDDRLWVCRFDDVMKYGQERDSATLTVTENTSDRIAFTLTDLMKDELFDFPLTVKVHLPDAWTGVTATQGGKSIPVRIVSHENVNYALVKAVPDRGTVVLTK